MKKQNSKNPKGEIKTLLEWSKEDLKSAQNDLVKGFFRSAISRAYYAAFDVARAALISHGIITKTHRGLANKFHQIFIKEESILPIKLGKWFHVALEERQNADYGIRESFTKVETVKFVRDAEEFVAEVKKYLKTIEK